MPGTCDEVGYSVHVQTKKPCMVQRESKCATCGFLGGWQQRTMRDSSTEKLFESHGLKVAAGDHVGKVWMQET